MIVCDLVSKTIRNIMSSTCIVTAVFLLFAIGLNADNWSSSESRESKKTKSHHCIDCEPYCVRLDLSRINISNLNDFQYDYFGNLSIVTNQQIGDAQAGESSCYTFM